MQGLLEPRQSRNRACLRQWQQELRLLKGDQSDQSMRQVGHFYKVIYHSSGGLQESQLLTSLCTCFRTGSCSPAPLMVTGQPLLIQWEICPSISVRMKISLVSWIVSTETDPKAGGESPPGTSRWFLHQLTKVHFEQLKRLPRSI